MPGQAAHAPVAPPRQGRLYALRGLVALVLIAALVGVVGAGEIGSVLLEVEPLALVLSAPLILGAWLLSGLALWVLCRGGPGNRLGLREFLPPYAASTFVALWLPGRVGDFSIVYLLRQRFSVIDSLSFVVVDKLLSVVALTFCAVLAAFAYAPAAWGLAAGAGFVATWAGALYALTHRRAAAALVRAMPRALRRRLLEAVRCLHRALERGNVPALSLNLALKLARVALVGVLMVVLVDGFGDTLSLRLATLGAAAVQLLALVPISVQGLGVQEFAYLYVYDIEQVNQASVVLASFASRLVSIAVVAALYVGLGGATRAGDTAGRDGTARADAHAPHAGTGEPRTPGGAALDVCYALSYRAPDYIRTRNLLAALDAMDGVRVHRAINRRRGVLRYLETLRALRRVLRAHPAALVLLGFRGHELYPLVRLMAPGRRIVVDAMMSPSAAMIEERGPLARVLGRWVLRPVERWIYRDCALVLTDTTAHMRFMARLFELPEERFAALPVAAHEDCPAPRRDAHEPRTVLFYGSFLPLHGFDVILDAMRRVRCEGLRWCFVGLTGSGRAALDALLAERPALDVRVVDYVPFDRLLEEHLARAWLFLGGPFGGTPQAQRVITGKTAQALCAGVPVVVGANEAAGALADRRECLLVPQRDAAALAAAVDWACSHEERLAAIGQAGARYYREHLSTEVVRRELAPLIARVAARAGSAAA